MTSSPIQFTASLAKDRSQVPHVVEELVKSLNEAEPKEMQVTGDEIHDLNGLHLIVRSKCAGIDTKSLNITLTKPYLLLHRIRPSTGEWVDTDRGPSVIYQVQDESTLDICYLGAEVINGRQ